MNDKLCFPNYKDGSIINLMASIQNAYGKRKSEYGELKFLKSSEIKKFDNIIVLVIDGLGYDYVKKYGKKGIMARSLKEKITTVFPPTTPCAIASFLNGTPPSKHGILGFFLYISEIKETIVTIRHGIRAKGSLPENIKFEEIYKLTPFSNKIDIETYHIDDENVTDSIYTTAQSGKSKIIGHKGINDCFNKLKEVIQSNKNKKYIYAHIPNHDLLCHDFGLDSKEALEDYNKTDLELKKFLDEIKGTNTMIIVTADHGMINIPKENMILIKDYPELKKTLTLPMYGQSRYANCIVKDKEKFKKIISEKFKDKCEIFNKNEAEKLYGLKINEKFKERIGDFLLVMKKDYGIYDLPPKQSYETYDYNTCDHGGLTENEMYVPLIVINSN